MMKTSIFILTIPLAILGIALGGLRYLEYSENPRSKFASFRDMEAAGIIAAGWLPDYLPRSAIQIEESHNLDTNKVWASFKYQVGDLQLVEAACKKVAENSRGKKYLCPPLDTRTSTIVLGNDGSGHYLSYNNGI